MRPSILAALVVLALAGPALAPTPAHAAADHVVISEFATRGPASATDEFVELYNPTDAAISIAGWKLQYKSATGTTWNDRAILPAGTTIAAHGYFLIVNQTSYAGSVAGDYSSGLWTSGTGMADNGHERIVDASLVEVDMVGWGSTAIAPEGGVPAPNHGTSANNLSVERKAFAGSTADSLAAGGAHALLGNGQDTNVNGSDYVTQTHGRDPQNSGSGVEPAFASGGNGTGHAAIAPATVFTSRSGTSVTLTFSQDSAYTVTDLAVLVPTEWTWSHSTADVTLSGPAFAAATASVVGETLFVSSAALTLADGGTLTLDDLTTPATKGSTTFTVRSAVASGTLTLISPQPSVRVLELVPIVALHVNDASGVPVAPYAVGSEATVTGIVTANLSTLRTDVYVQDGTAGINLYNPALAPVTLVPGDSITVTGSILQFRGLTELQPDFNLLTVHASGRPVPEPEVMTCAELNATFQPDYTEPDESRLIRINGVTYNSVNSTISDATGTALIFIPISYPAPPAVFDAVGILKQYKPGVTAPPPPYTTDYEIAPRTPDDIIAHPGPILLSGPVEDAIQSTSVEIHWTTDVASSSVVRFGLTAAFGDSVVDTTSVTAHVVTLTGLTPATVYSYSAGSSDVDGSNFSTTRLFSTASPAASTGQMNAYFNKSVRTDLAWLHEANGNADLTSILVGRLDAARRSVDAAIYSLSGTPGTALANALIAAKNRGVKVRVITEYDNIGSAALNSLSAAGITVINDRFDPINFGAGLMHDKFFVIDARGGAPESVWVWTGSWNPTDPGTANDYQNVLEVQDQALGNVFTMEFQEMWGSATETPNASVSRFGARKLDDTPHRFAIGGHDVEAYFSPSDATTSHLLSVINSAQHTLGFQVLTLTRSDIANALIARHNAGVNVRGDLDNGTDSGSEYANLVAAGVDVRLNDGSGLLHHKYLLADATDIHHDGVVLTGSHNWSAAAENSNNENTLIVRDPDLANQYLQEFTARYYQFGGTDSVHVGAVSGLAGPGVAWLGQNHPNPARGSTRIEFSLPAAGPASLRVFDVQGRLVRTLVEGVRPAGRHQVTLDGRDLAAGVYLVRLEAGATTTQRKLLFLR